MIVWLAQHGALPASAEAKQYALVITSKARSLWLVAIILLFCQCVCCSNSSTLSESVGSALYNLHLDVDSTRSLNAPVSPLRCVLVTCSQRYYAAS